ncbi:MAG TPA: peptidoglycan-binding protein [Jiangellaceae bacterium]
MRSNAGSADRQLVAGGVTLGIVLLAAFIAALFVSGVLSGGGAGADNIAIAGGAQTLDPTDPNADTAADNAVTEETTTEPGESEASSVLLSLGDTGEKVRELQARLRQLQWYQADVTGEFDEATLQAVEGFQAKRGLEPTGEVDQKTWDQLVEMTTTPTEDEMHNRLEAGPTILGPGDEGDEVRELQARLKQIGWFDYEVTGVYGTITTAAVEGFQTRRGVAATGEVDQNTWDLLVEMTRDPTDAELNNDPSAPPPTASGLPEQCVAGRVLCIDRADGVLRWVVDGAVEMTLAARFGTEPAPVREGEFDVFQKRRNYESSGDTDMPYSLLFDTGQAVHYSADFDENGYNGSTSGSVNIGDEDAMQELFDQVSPGDGVFVYRS